MKASRSKEQRGLFISGSRLATAETETFFKPTRDQFGRCFPAAGNLEYQAFLGSCVEFELWTAERVAAGFAQWHHESVGLTRLEEDFGWTAAGLYRVFGPPRSRRVKSLEEAKGLVKRGPVAIAEAVYGGRLGNRPRGSGDGWNYRGRGPTMLTGRENYARAGEALNLPLEAKPDLVKLIEIGARVAGYFWHRAGCNALADLAAQCDADFVGITKAINGGDNGLADRQAQWKRIRGIFELPPIFRAQESA